MSTVKSHRGRVLIAFEGADGSGKTTQARRAVDYIKKKGREVVFVREPGGTRVGEKIRQILLDPELKEMCVRTELFLYMAARAQLAEEVLRSVEREEKVIVTDRYLLSSVVYQGMAGGIGTAIVSEMGHLAVLGIQPDLTIVLDIDRAEVEKRLKGKKDRMEQKDADFHERVRRGYAEAARSAGPETRLIPAGGEVEETEALIRKEIDRVLG